MVQCCFPLCVCLITAGRNDPLSASDARRQGRWRGVSGELSVVVTAGDRPVYRRDCEECCL